LLDWKANACFSEEMKAEPVGGVGGFSLVELLLIVGVIGVISSISLVSISNTRLSAENTKLASDVASVNRSVDLYRANGGNASDATADEIIRRMQTVADADTAAAILGMRHNFVDRRVRVRPVNTSSSDVARAIWDADNQRFNVEYSGSGVKFVFDEEMVSFAPVEEARAITSLRTQNGGWVWAFSDVPRITATGAGSPSVGSVPGTGLTGSPDFPFTNAWTITDPNGRVDVVDVYREAGYKTRLALVSLEGMEIYDLTTNQGRLAFMTELVRRAAEKDRAQVIIDRSITSGGNGVQEFSETYYFRPGDTVAAVIIPDGSFQDSYDRLLSGTTTDQTFPLTSLNMGTTDPPFYANQLASLGNDGYALEDIAGGGDADYDDIIFKASGLGMPENSTTREINAREYYPTRLQQLGKGYWNELESALETSGIITPN